jgi:glycosyltransferase involved in cell wall biosynthesis
MKILNSWPRTAWEILEFLPEIDYQNILRNAQLVIHPSLNEGFGIPAFEAYGEGARLLIHNQTPAYDLLGNHNGVMSGDLSNLSEITHSIKSALDIQKGSISKRREYLTSIGATWKAMAMNYANLYESYS